MLAFLPERRQEFEAFVYLKKALPYRVDAYLEKPAIETTSEFKMYHERHNDFLVNLIQFYLPLRTAINATARGRRIQESPGIKARKALGCSQLNYVAEGSLPTACPDGTESSGEVLVCARAVWHARAYTPRGPWCTLDL